jgi:hypothetical protein
VIGVWKIRKSIYGPRQAKGVLIKNLFKMGLVNIPSMIDASRHLTQLHTFFMTVGLSHIKIQAPGSSFYETR